MKYLCYNNHIRSRVFYERKAKMAAEETVDVNLEARVPTDPAARWLAMRAHGQLGLGQKITLGRELWFRLESDNAQPERSFVLLEDFTLMRTPGSRVDEARFRQYEVRTPGNMTVAQFRLYPNGRFVYTFAQ